jgi:predicted anti-sigma-YlaC factor YlaD
MKSLLSAKLEGRLFGLLKYYVNMHLSQCNQCRETLHALESLREWLVALRDTPEPTLSEEHQQRIQVALTESLARHRGQNTPPT